MQTEKRHYTRLARVVKTVVIMTVSIFFAECVGELSECPSLHYIFNGGTLRSFRSYSPPGRTSIFDLKTEERLYTTHALMDTLK